MHFLQGKCLPNCYGWCHFSQHFAGNSNDNGEENLYAAIRILRKSLKNNVYNGVCLFKRQFMAHEHA